MTAVEHMQLVALISSSIEKSALSIRGKPHKSLLYGGCIGAYLIDLLCRHTNPLAHTKPLTSFEPETDALLVAPGSRIQKLTAGDLGESAFVLHLAHGSLIWWN